MLLFKQVDESYYGHHACLSLSLFSIILRLQVAAKLIAMQAKRDVSNDQIGAFKTQLKLAKIIIFSEIIVFIYVGQPLEIN